MRRSRRLRGLWNWLPTFRAVAETEHLPSASKALHVSAASLSRTIGLLEAEIGARLFDRVGRRIQLNRAGKLLLDSVRDGMRVIDEGVSQVEGRHLAGPVNLWAEAAYARLFLLPLAGAIRRKYPELSLSIESEDANSVEVRLLRGQLDLAIVDTVRSNPQIEVELLCRIRFGLYCCSDHSLATQARPEISKIATSELFAVPGRALLCPLYHWPAQYERHHVIAVPDFSMAVEACRNFGMLAVLPDCLFGKSDTQPLHRLPLELFGTGCLYAVYRKAVGEHPSTSAILTILRELTDVHHGQHR